jgi:hypothetical protein
MCTVFARTPKLVELESNRDARLAPIVIVGLVEQDERVGHLVPSRKEPKIKLQIRKTRVHVENVLKGNVDQQVLSIYYFAIASGYDGPRPLGFWRPPSRRIFFIRRDGDVLRMACDVVDCTMPVTSGSHPGYLADSNKPIDYALVDINLTRGQGEIEDARFAYEIGWSIPATPLGGYVIDKLQHLVSTEPAVVKTAACEMLWIYTRDRSDTQLVQAANDGLRSAQCVCAVKPDGNLACQ